MIRDAYDRAAAIIGQGAESIEVAQEVERLRLAWRPSCVRVVMLAESHVWTSEDEAVNRFVRFVYCLAYGEKSLAPRVAPNTGTLQYWRLFHDAIHEPDLDAKIWPGSPSQRILAKQKLLNELKLAGIWLMDACITALYQPSKGQLLRSRTDYKKVLRACWEAHVGGVIADCHTSAVLIVGKGVDAAIGDLVRQAPHQAKVAVKVVKQPAAFMRKGEGLEERHEVFDFCRLHRASGPYIQFPHRGQE